MNDQVPPETARPSSLGQRIKGYVDLADVAMEHADEFTARARRMRRIARENLRKAVALIERRLKGCQ